MAGGENAAIMPCLKCAGPAHRTYEGQEDDRYRCSECGFEFGMDWSVDGPPQTPRWPISEEEAGKIREMAALVFGTGEEAGDFEKGKAEVKIKSEKIFVNKRGRIIKGSISGMEKEELQSIGSARMEEDGTIVLELRAEGPKGLTGDALLRYPPGHPEYNNVLRHLGGLKKGEVKQVPPWPQE